MKSFTKAHNFRTRNSARVVSVANVGCKHRLRYALNNTKNNPLHVPLLQTMRGGIVRARCRARVKRPLAVVAQVAFIETEEGEKSASVATQLTPRSVPSAN